MLSFILAQIKFKALTHYKTNGECVENDSIKLVK